MTLKTVYERFLASPNAAVLSETATLHYVTTLKSYSQQGPILRHLETQFDKVMKKKSEKVIDAVEGNNSLALEVETTLEFVSDGGAYLPGLDNFIVDSVVTFPITHIVHFDKNGQIAQIRLSWDQGSLLKQVDVIGVRGKNWPIVDGPAQIKLITSSSNSAADFTPVSPPPRGRANDYDEYSAGSASPSKKFIKDPHKSLDVFDPPMHQRLDSSGPSAVRPRDSAKPAAREYNELFAAGHEDHQPSPGGSPNKAHAEKIVPPKGAGSRRFESSNLFQEDQNYSEPKIYKTNPARYNHFDIGDAQEDDPMQHRSGTRKEEKDRPMVARANKNASQWDFDDFATPAKLPQRHRAQDEVHFSLEDQIDQQAAPGQSQPGVRGRKDTETHFDFADDGTPIQRLPANTRARKDAELHFDFTDEPTPAPRRIIARTKAAAGLYRDPLAFDEDEDEAPLANITNKPGHKKNFGSQWDATDESPSNGQGAAAASKPASATNRARKGLESSWDF